MIYEETEEGRVGREKYQEYAPNILKSYYIFLIVMCITFLVYVYSYRTGNYLYALVASTLVILYSFDLHYRKIKAVVKEVGGNN